MRRAKIGVEKMSVWLMLLFSFLTLGAFPSIWFVLRLDAINKIATKRSGKLSREFVVAVAVLSVIASLAAFMGIAVSLVGSDVTEGVLSAVEKVINLFAGIGLIVLSFQVRKILNLKFKAEVSGVFTFIFGAFYLQHRINRLHLTGGRITPGY